MKKRFRSRLKAAGACIVIAGTLTLPTQTALAASRQEPASDSPAVSVADLADSSADQQRWLAEPESRIVLNPSHSQTDDTRTKADNALDTMFYADQNKHFADAVVRNSLTIGDAPASTAGAIDEGDQTPLLHDDFGDDVAQRWPTSADTGYGATMVAAANGATITLPDGTDWGSVERHVSLDVDAAPILMITVTETTGMWALKITPQGQDDVTVQIDTTATGTFAYDLEALGLPSGDATIKLFASHRGTATFDALSVHARPDTADDFSDLSGWRTDVQSNNGARITPAASGIGATITSTSDSGYGAVAKKVTVDLTKTPMLTIAVGPLSSDSQWALKLTDENGSRDFATLQEDTTATGVFSYDMAAITGLTGEQTFGIKLFSTKYPTPTTATFTRISFHAGTGWLQSPSSSTNTWNPQSLDWTGTYGESSSYSTQDLFVDSSTVARIVHPDDDGPGTPTLAGNFAAAADWNAASRALSIPEDGYTRAVAFPADAQVLFFDNASAASLGVDGTAAPTSTSRSWVAVLPDDHDTAIGFGYAYGADRNAAITSATGGADADAVADALDARTSEWNEYLRKVPTVQDYSLHAVSAEGTTPEEIRSMYYRSFVDLRQSVVPPQPESGISHHQVATGKAALYNGGSSRNKASASWDSLLGIQYLGYTEPELAWDSLVGMMADVEPDGGLNGEALPSRKAQTAWMLYTITGDQDRLAEVYPAVKAHMDWSSRNLAWNLDSHYPGGGVNPADERDAEFVNSLAIDLDYAAESARVLGLDADAQSFAALKATLTDQYEEWFFMPDGRAVQYFWTSHPDATYEQRMGTVNYVGTGLHLDGLSDAAVTAILERFDAEYDASAQFAGTASLAVKAPDAQFIAYGLLEHDEAVKAQVYLEAVLRDITRTNRFSEVYQAGTDGAAPISRGESPTTFGMAQVIDNLWILNGYRSDEGVPTFVQLPGATGGVSGLTYLGRSLSVDLTGTAVLLGGDAADQPGVCSSIDTTDHVVLTMTTTCGDLSLSTASVEAGHDVTVSASNFEPLTPVRVELHSDPVVLAEATTTDGGTLVVSVTIPKSTPVGDHTIVVTSNGIVAQASLTVTAADAVGDGGDGDSGDSPATGADSGTTGGALASTGLDATLPLAGIALSAALLAIGAVAARRRKSAATNG